MNKFAYWLFFVLWIGFFVVGITPLFSFEEPNYLSLICALLSFMVIILLSIKESLDKKK